jgi:predicted RNA-binding Zn-ribbon protein involved in translation (DUF1610 family)
MALYTYCKSCKINIILKLKTSNWTDLLIANGGKFYVKCQNCRKIEKKYVSDIKVGSNFAILHLGVVVGIIVTIILWICFGAIGTVSVIIPFLFWK